MSLNLSISKSENNKKVVGKRADGMTENDQNGVGSNLTYYFSIKWPKSFLDQILERELLGQYLASLIFSCLDLTGF